MKHSMKHHPIPNSLIRYQRDEDEVLAALQKEPQSTDDLVMLCHMGRAAVQGHLRHLSETGMIEREMSESDYGGKPHLVRTGRYMAVIRADSHELECIEAQAVA